VHEDKHSEDLEHDHKQLVEQGDEDNHHNHEDGQEPTVQDHLVATKLHDEQLLEHVETILNIQAIAAQARNEIPKPPGY
jgi:hypothetical protein